VARRPVLGPLTTANERLVALEVIRQVLLLRFSLHVRQLMVDALNATEQPIGRLVRDALRTDAGLRDPAQVRQLDRLIDQINAMREPAWQAGGTAVEAEMVALGDAEPEEQRDLFTFLLPGLSMLLPTGVGLAAAALPFQGRTLRQWLADARQDDARRIRQALYAGAAAGEDPATVARRVLGTASAKGTDGATQVSRNHVDTIVRSATTHFGAVARDQFYRANAAVRYVAPPLGTARPLPRPLALGTVADSAVAAAARQASQAAAAAAALAGGRGEPVGKAVFLLEQFVAILDSRTTKLCRGLDGNRYKLGEGPVPPLHLNCRSNRVLVLPEALGGPLYDPGEYGDWVRRQPFAAQVLLMGASRAGGVRDGKVDPGGFMDYGARPTTLGQVRDEVRRLMGSYQ